MQLKHGGETECAIAVSPMELAGENDDGDADADNVCARRMPYTLAVFIPHKDSAHVLLAMR